MICKRIKPSPFVSQFIKEYLLVHLIFDKNEKAPVKTYPINPKEGITFQFKGHIIAETPTLNLTEKRPKVNIFSIPSARQNLYQTHEFMFVNVEFQSGYLSHFLRIPMTEITTGNLDASLVFGKEIEEVNDQLANTETYEDIPRVLDKFFLNKIKELQINALPIDKIGNLILSEPSKFNLDKIAKTACMSHRTFENKFLQKVGVTPKYFARICRFYKAYEQKELFPELDWLCVAVHNGYSDYQHLAKDFKQFAGVNPNIFIEDANQNPEKRLQANPDFIGI